MIATNGNKASKQHRNLTILTLASGLLAIGLTGTQRIASAADAAAGSMTLSPTSEPAQGEAGGNSQAELAKKLNNPVANLISVPFQFNYDTGYGPKDSEKLTLNIQPVIPVTLNDDWNVIVRTIAPVIYQDSPADGVDSTTGMGDILQSFFFSPKEPVAGGWVVGVGPAFLYPSATDEMLGGEKLGMGPTAVLLKQEHGWTYGILANHIWSVAGESDRSNINSTFLQPFFAYTTKTYTTFTINTESTYDWIEHQWTTPLNAMVTQLLKIDGKPISFGIGGRYYASKPEGGPEWGARFIVTFLFPKN